MKRRYLVVDWLNITGNPHHSSLMNLLLGIAKFEMKIFPDNFQLCHLSIEISTPVPREIQNSKP